MRDRGQCFLTPYLQITGYATTRHRRHAPLSKNSGYATGLKWTSEFWQKLRAFLPLYNDTVQDA